MKKETWEIKFNSINKKESVLVIQNYLEKNTNKNVFKIIAFQGDISKIKNNILGNNIDEIVKNLKLEGLEIIRLESM